MNASMRMPTTIAVAISRNWASGTSASMPKPAASASAAVVIAREARGTDPATASRSGRRRPSGREQVEGRDKGAQEDREQDHDHYADDERDPRPPDW
jgi:hypothetical protein